MNEVYKQVTNTYTSKYNYKTQVVISAMNSKVKYSNNPNWEKDNKRWEQITTKIVAHLMNVYSAI